MPLCLFWLVGRERNQGAFEEVEHSPTDLKLLLLRTLYVAGCFSSSVLSIFTYIIDSSTFS